MQKDLLTLNEMFTNAFHNYSKKTALNFKGRSMSYYELRISSNKIAHSLIDSGIKNNSRVALLMSNSLEYVISLMGIYQSGGTRVALNDMLGENEILYILRDSGAKILIVEEKFFQKILNIKDKLPKLNTIVGVSKSGSMPKGFVDWKSFSEHKFYQDLHTPMSINDYAGISYTGGTTGKPKGVISNQLSTSHLIMSVSLTSEILDDEVMLLTTPLPHASGLYLMAGLLQGVEIHIEDKFNVDSLLKSIEKYEITFLNMVPTMIYRVLDHLKKRMYDVSSIRTIIYGTAPITYERLKEALKVFGQVFIQTYGLTESPGVATKLSKQDHSLKSIENKKLKSCGQSTMFSRVAIVDENENEREVNEEGEIIIKALSNMVGYHNLPDKTNDTLKDGWIYTGDIGKKDEEGFLYLLDRKKDMIITGGLNVYSSEVENAIQKHPLVSQVAVIGVPHPDWGEAVTAYLMLRNNEEKLTEQDIKNWCKDELSKYKQPKSVYIVESFPLTPYGKIDKKKLKEPFWSQIGGRI